MSDNEEEKLHRLLQLKHAEQPEDGFWDDFEKKFQERCLQATIKPARMQCLCAISQRVLRPSLAAISAGALAALIYFSPTFSNDGQAFNDAIPSEYLRVSMETFSPTGEWVSDEVFEDSGNIFYVSGASRSSSALFTASQL